MSRAAGKALADLCREHGGEASVFSVYDQNSNLDPAYFPACAFRGFGGNRLSFVWHSLRTGRKATAVLLSHINLLPVGYAIQKLSPGTKLYLLAHGIEVWQPFPAWKRAMLKACTGILPVSRFTREKMIGLYGLDPARLTVVNNCLDPFLTPLSETKKCPALLARYGLTEEHQVMLTLTRLSFRERYKGYDEVLMALKELKKTKPLLRYLLVGRYDAREKRRLDRFIRQQGLEKEVVFAGFVPDSELAQHFAIADVYVMPSRKEGFGIVFIEALYYGKPVIAGNVDGSADALAGGAFGALVHPDYPAEIQVALEQALQSRRADCPSAETVLARFGFPVYKQALSGALQTVFTGDAINTPSVRRPAPPSPTIKA